MREDGDPERCCGAEMDEASSGAKIIPVRLFRGGRGDGEGDEEPRGGG